MFPSFFPGDDGWGIPGGGVFLSAVAWDWEVSFPFFFSAEGPGLRMLGGCFGGFSELGLLAGRNPQALGELGRALKRTLEVMCLHLANSLSKKHQEAKFSQIQQQAN